VPSPGVPVLQRRFAPVTLSSQSTGPEVLLTIRGDEQLPAERRVCRTLALTGLDRLIPIYSTQSEALCSEAVA
jgi:hypothetical protein